MAPETIIAMIIPAKVIATVPYSGKATNIKHNKQKWTVLYRSTRL